MKKHKAMAMVLTWIVLMLTGSSRADESYFFDVKVICPEQYTVQSPFEGAIQTVYVREGDVVEAGDKLYTMSTKSLVSGERGKVIAVQAEPGSDGASTKEKYDGAVVLEREYPYYVDAQAKGSVACKLGDTVYLFAQMSQRQGTGQIIRIKDGMYTVEIRTGNLNAGESVVIYPEEPDNMTGGESTAQTEAESDETGNRDEETEKIVESEANESQDDAENGISFMNRIGKGTVSAFEYVYYNYEGYASDVLVKPGDRVQTGDVLLTYAPSKQLDLMADDKSTVVSATLENGITLAPLKDYCFVAYLDSANLELLESRQSIFLTSAREPEKEMPAHISWISAATNTEGKYEIRFICDELEASDCRLGRLFYGEAE